MCQDSINKKPIKKHYINIILYISNNSVFVHEDIFFYLMQQYNL